MWESLAIRLPWEQESAGSNPAIPAEFSRMDRLWGEKIEISDLYETLNFKSQIHETKTIPPARSSTGEPSADNRETKVQLLPGRLNTTRLKSPRGEPVDRRLGIG